MITKEFIAAAKTYKRKVAGSFMLIDGAKISEKINEKDLCVTKKIDGSMQMLFLREGKACLVSTNGLEKQDLPCLDEFVRLAEKSGIKDATVVAELYATISQDGRERVGDVSTAYADCKLHDKLKLGIFDILDLNGEPFVSNHYKETLSKIQELFSGELVHPVQYQSASSKQDVQNLFEQWVVENGAEGLVVHSESPIVYKIKPRHSIDAVVIGFTAGEDELNDSIRDILVAVMNEEGNLQQFAATGNGFTQAERKELFSRFVSMGVESDYIETDDRNVAYHMIRPEVVVELSAVDLVAENSSGEAKMNILLSYAEGKGYVALGKVPGISAHSLVFQRIREDKTANQTDIRLSQLSDICEFTVAAPVMYGNLPESEVLVRRVFKKGDGAKLMIQKYIVWKTNKESHPAYPAYVFHYTDFSAGRKEPLKRDIRVSSNKDQIMEFLDQFIIDNVKKGWEEVR